MRMCCDRPMVWHEETWLCTNPNCHLQTPVATPGANLCGEDSVGLGSESSRPQGLQDKIRRAREFHSKVHEETYGVGGNKVFDRLVEAVNHIDALLLALERPAVHPDPTGKTREPPHCPSCHCETPSMLDQIRQNDKNTSDVWFTGVRGACAEACKDRRWLLGEVERLLAFNERQVKDFTRMLRKARSEGT